MSAPSKDILVQFNQQFGVVRVNSDIKPCLLVLRLRVHSSDDHRQQLETALNWKRQLTASFQSVRQRGRMQIQSFAGAHHLQKHKHSGGVTAHLR